MFFLRVIIFNFPVVWVVFLGFCVRVVFLGSLCFFSSGVSIFTAFYLFVGGVMCVCGFFCCFFWRWNFKVFLLPSVFVRVIFLEFVFENFKFKSRCFFELLFGWSLVRGELFLGLFRLLVSLFIVLFFAGGGVGSVRGWEV